MLQITADLSALTAEQSQAVAAFILNFPRNDNHAAEVIADSENVTFSGLVAHSEEDEPTPEQVFGAVSGNLAAMQDAKIAALPGPVLVPTQAATSIAPVVAALPALPTNGAAALDKDGLPWDERIHSSNRAINADGSWRTKRGVDKALVASVESELKILMGLPGPVAGLPTVVPSLQAFRMAMDGPVFVGNDGHVLPAAPAPSTTAFVKLLSKATSLIQGGKLTQDEVSSVVAACGLPSLVLLGNRLDLVPQVEASIDAMVAGR